MTLTETHDAGALPVAGDPSNFPSHAELVRTLLVSAAFGTLTTLSEEGYPYGSLAACSALPDGSVLMCLSDMAEHTQNARRVSRAGLFVAAARAADDTHDPLDEPRVSIVGELRPHDATPEDVQRHLDLHPLTADYMEFSDFGWWRLDVVSARFVGGFGSMSWVDGAEIAAASPDPVLPHARSAIVHMNADHPDACLDMVRALAGLDTATSAVVHAVDRHGMTLYADTADGHRVVRLGFPGGPLDDPADVRGAVVELTKRARAAEEAP